MIKGSIQEEGKTIVNICAPNIGVFLLQQTVRSLREATHVALTSTLPPTSEFAIWMDPTF